MRFNDQKARSLLVCPKNCNAANKLVYGGRMLEKARKYYKLMPEDIFVSEKNRTALMMVMEALLRSLFMILSVSWCCLLSHQWMLLTATITLHIPWHLWYFSHLVFQTIDNAVKAMLATQEMKFFLRTAFGDSKEKLCRQHYPCKNTGSVSKKQWGRICRLGHH